MDIVTLDFETYYDSEYTLGGKLSTSEYVCDERFHIHGVGIKINSKRTCWVTGDQVKRTLQDIDWTTCAMLGHNTYFEGFICSHRFGVIPKFYYDTLCMSRAVHAPDVKHNLDSIAKLHGLKGKVLRAALEDAKGERYLTKSKLRQLGKYCKNDVDDTYKLFHIMRKHLPEDELELIDLTLRMFTEPTVRIDEPELKRHLEEERAAKIAVLFKNNCTKEDLNSSAKFADLLIDAGLSAHQLPMKYSLTTGERIFAFAKTDREFQALRSHPNEKIRNLAEARLKLKSNIDETRAERLLLAGKNRQPVPIMLNYSGAHTHRWSGGGKLNFQNPKRDGWIRECIVAPPGYRFCVADSRQIEARTIAWFAGQSNIVRAFAQNKDVYKLQASEIYGKPENEISSLERFIGKVCLGENTRVLTKSGWKPITDIALNDKLWDGEQWVNHRGLIYRGYKPTLTHCGVTATKDHEILTEHGWEAWSTVLTNPSLFRSALESASLPLSTGSPILNPLAGSPLHAVLAAGKGATSLNARNSKQRQNAGGNIKTLCPTTSIEEDCLTDYRLASLVAITTAAGASLFSHLVALSSLMYKHCPAGIDLLWNWIESTLMGITNPVTSASLLDKKISRTNEESTILKKKSHVYDLTCAGPKRRFTIWSDKGPLIVHNCVLGLGYGMGHTRLKQTLEQGLMGPAVFLDTKECMEIVNIWRLRNNMIVTLWKDLDRILTSMYNGTAGSFGPISYGKEYIGLPNGLFLQYPQLERADGDYTYMAKKGRTKIYSGLLAENITQALARIIIGEQMLKIKRKNNRIVCMAHDDITVVEKTSKAHRTLASMIQIMRQAPEWAPGLPLDASGGINRKFVKPD